MSNTFFEIAEKLKNRELDMNSKEVKDIENVLMEMASTEDGRTEIAEVIGVYLQEQMNKIDIAPLITDSKHFNLGDRPEFRLKKKGIKAYWIAPNSSTPKSKNYQETLGMDFETLSVRPECLLDELKAGRISSLQELLTDGQEALRTAIVEKVFTILGQVYNEQGAGKDFTTICTSALEKSAVEKAIDAVTYRTGKNAVILGDKLLTNQIMGFDGFTNEANEEIRKNGTLGYFRGARIVGVNDVYDEALGKSLVPKDRLFVLSDKIGYSATYGDVKTGQENSIEDWSWNARVDMEWGIAITNPKGIQVIQVK
ncbi:MAG: HK97-fold major capsid protein [Peptoniphilus harei]|nr:HK97-fold major capsid protein [Peptoniphilus harei]